MYPKISQLERLSSLLSIQCRQYKELSKKCDNLLCEHPQNRDAIANSIRQMSYITSTIKNLRASIASFATN